MDTSAIEKILYNAMGLSVSSVGSTAVLRSVQERMLACGIADIGQYTRLLKSDENELRELVEEVVVPETWFFRDKQPFKMLNRFVKQEWLPAEPARPLRVLSLPCATGEEPYSIAITLIEAGLMPSQLKIDAFDISERNIRRCRTAHYTENSFRGVEPAIRDRYFSRREGRYHPDILIRAMVNFDIASVLAPDFVNTRQAYDMVFCRNLLIYFDRQTQAQVVKVLDKLLNPSGMLFVGHAETGIFINNWYPSQRYPKSFIVRKFVDDPDLSKKSSKRRPVIQSESQRRQKNSLQHQLVRRTRSTELEPRQGPPVRPLQNHNTDQILEQARRFADSGKLTEAEATCLRYLETNKQDKDAYNLLALIQLATGDLQKAVQYFKNVVYLDPEHYDALMYLSTLMGEQGDEQGATRYRERAQRIKNRQELRQVSA